MKILFSRYQHHVHEVWAQIDLTQNEDFNKKLEAGFYNPNLKTPKKYNSTTFVEWTAIPMFLQNPSEKPGKMGTNLM